MLFTHTFCFFLHVHFHFLYPPPHLFPPLFTLHPSFCFSSHARPPLRMKKTERKDATNVNELYTRSPSFSSFFRGRGRETRGSSSLCLGFSEALMHLCGIRLSPRSEQFVPVVLGLGATRNPQESQNTKRRFLGTESFCTFAQLEDSSCRQPMKEFKSRMSFSAFSTKRRWAGQESHFLRGQILPWARQKKKRSVVPAATCEWSAWTPRILP